MHATLPHQRAPVNRLGLTRLDPRIAVFLAPSGRSVRYVVKVAKHPVPAGRCALWIALHEDLRRLSASAEQIRDAMRAARRDRLTRSLAPGPASHVARA
jgi:hypothetical protein